MPFYNPITTVSVLPHIFSQMDRQTKSFYRDKYRKIKKTVTTGSMITVGTLDGVQLAKDVLSSKLRAYGYRSFFFVAAGPIVQFLSLPLYIFSYGTSLRKYANVVSEIGAKITAGEMGTMNWVWIGCDIVLFGEPVSIMDDSSLMILSNETTGAVSEILDEIG